MDLKSKVYYTMAPSELAEWLRRQEADSWWTVDGDSYLMERISFPCPGENIAKVLSGMTKPLLFFGEEESPAETGRKITADELDHHVIRDEYGNRVLPFCWEKDSPAPEWLLIEDKETAQVYRDMEKESE